MLAYVPYHTSRDGFLCQVAYALFQNKAVFTGCTPAHFGSTINRVEDIASAIARATNKPVDSLRFFDLQTRTVYGRCYIHRPHPGDFVFDEILFDNRLVATDWRPTICPEHIIDLFGTYIDGEPHQVLIHGIDRAQPIHF